MGPIEEADPIPTTEPIFVQVPRAEHQEEIEHQPEEMNPNRDGLSAVDNPNGYLPIPIMSQSSFCHFPYPCVETLKIEKGISGP